ncbi:MAG TPA: hypothetical protein VEW66_04715 [Thermomicrobiales bacterium]|nr:hypothetical protein [Thermomicrobiales bacterium]
MLAVIAMGNSGRAEARADVRTAAQHYGAPGEQVNALPLLGSPPIEQQMQVEELEAVDVPVRLPGLRAEIEHRSGAG